MCIQNCVYDKIKNNNKKKKERNFLFFIKKKKSEQYTMNRIMTKSTITSTTGQQQQKQQHTYHIPTPPPPVPPIVPHRGSLVEIALENTSREAARLRTDLTNIRIQRDELLAQVTQLRSTANMSADERVAQADMRVAALESKLATALANFPSETIMLNTIEQLNDRLRLVTGELNHLREEMTQKEDLLKKVDLEQQLLRNEITSLTACIIFLIYFPYIFISL